MDTILVESGTPKNSAVFVKVEQDGMTLYIRPDMHFSGGYPVIDLVHYRGEIYLLVKNMKM